VTMGCPGNTCACPGIMPYGTGIGEGPPATSAKMAGGVTVRKMRVQTMILRNIRDIRLFFVFEFGVKPYFYGTIADD
jgi:hypothetical protein